jgi:hypothetical protein
MLRLSLLGFGAYAAVCMVAGSASAEDIKLRCGFYRIDLSDSTVNGENRQIDWVHVKGPKSFQVAQTAPLMPTPSWEDDATLRLRWHEPSPKASVPAADFLLDLLKGRLDVIDSRGVESFNSRCINLSLKLAV